MNASATIRLSLISTSGLSLHTGRLSQLKEWPNFLLVDSSLNSHPTNKHSSLSQLNFDIEQGTYIDIATKKERKSQVHRMLTIFPYRDPTYLVAIGYVLGSILFTINAFFGLLPLIASSLDFPTETEALFATLFLGLFFFTIAGFLDVISAPKAGRDVCNIKDSTKLKKQNEEVHEPAFLGGRDWAKVPQQGKYTDLMLNSVPFQAALLQLIGTFFLTIPAFASLPGAISPDSPSYPTFVYGPDLVGGFLFFAANAMLLISSEQDKWWKPKLGKVGWHAAFQSTVGGFCFGLIGVFLLAGWTLASAWVTFVGSWTFMIGSFLGWYVTMEVC